MVIVMIDTLLFVAYRMDAYGKPPKHSKNLLEYVNMTNHFLTFISVLERLFDELVKEWLKNRYTVVSGSFREVNGRKVRIRKGHLRRKC